jgi:uncharacterized protein GlcG (DUF336 family)
MSTAVVRRPTLAHEAARALVIAAQERADELGHPIAVAVVDDAGVLKAFERMDGAPLLTVQIAQDKAYTAAGFGLTTDAWRDMLVGDRGLGLAAPAAIARLVAIGGGAPIDIEGLVVGGIGISGGTPEQDSDVAAAAVARVAENTRLDGGGGA